MEITTEESKAEKRKLTPEEWKAENDRLVDDIVSHEIEVRGYIKEMLPPLEFPTASVTIKKKIDELHEAFSNDGIPLNDHVIVPVESKYLLTVFTKYVADLDKFFMGLIGAIQTNDDATIHTLIEGAPARQQLWEDINTHLENFDFKEDLDRVFESDPLIPRGMTKEQAKATCIAELERISYGQKSDQNTNEGPTTGIAK